MTFSLLYPWPAAANRARRAWAPTRKSPAGGVNVVPGLLSIQPCNPAFEADEQVPAVVALSVADGHHACLDWVPNMAWIQQE